MRVSLAERRTRPAWLAPILALVGLVILARVFVGAAYADRVYPGVRVAGVDVGGQTLDQATATLQSRFTATDKPVTIQAADVTLNLSPSELGAHPQAQILAAAAFQAGRSGNPRDTLIGPVVAAAESPSIAAAALVDDAALSRAVDRIGSQVDRAPKDARLEFQPSVAIQPAVTGRVLDRARARDEIRAYLEAHVYHPASKPLALDVASTQPKVTDAELAPLRDQAQHLLSGPVAFTYGQQSWPIDPTVLQAGLAVAGSPLRLTVRDGAFDPALATVQKSVDRAPRDAKVVIAQGKARIEQDVPGQQLDRAATLKVLNEKIGAGATTIPIAVAPIDPTVKAADLTAVAADAQSLMDKGLTLTAQDQPFPVTGAQMGDLLTIQRDGAQKWQVSLDPAKVNGLIAQINEKFQHPTPDARFGWKNGKVIPLKSVVPGRVIDAKKATQVILEKWRAGKVDLPVTEAPIKVDDALLARLNADLKGVIAERSISYVGSIPERAHNINLALSKINGTVVMPGETFSFNRDVGPMTLGAGFTWGFAYSTGSNGQSQVIPSVAGGICQVATSVFQPVFWAGYEIDERHPHMFPMKSYADKGYMGLDATVAPEDGVDMVWKNDSDHAVLIRAWGDGEETNVQLITTKPNWTVRVDPEVISNVVPPPAQAVRSTSPMFARGREIVLEVAQDGLTSHVTRHVIYPDGHERTLKLASDYQPSPLSILVGTG